MKTNVVFTTKRCFNHSHPNVSTKLIKIYISVKHNYLFTILLQQHVSTLKSHHQAIFRTICKIHQVNSAILGSQMATWDP